MRFLKVFKLKDFRPLQRAAINAVLSKKDAVVILSTGGGKSLCYQIPAIFTKGLTLVISPLISLIENQISQLTKLGIEAASLNASSSKDEIRRIEAAITNKDSNFRLLYVTPEKLSKSKRIMNKIEKSLSVGFLKLIAIDEVHCCSQWGHDFRPDFAFLNVLRRQFKSVPILGLTATATNNVLNEVKEMLNIQSALTFRAGFNRPNLKYEVRAKKNSDEQGMKEIAEIISNRFKEQSGIVYCLSRKDCENLAKFLRDSGISAKHYHADLDQNNRYDWQERWMSGDIQVIVATIAFGMGIDKPDVRFVIHHSLPKSIENYYQNQNDRNPTAGFFKCHKTIAL
ncbi:unnamed protein product [Caenorhabditis bovis]|uniref:DNA 3'-5' helicase n=1 Tax=Caenorhabditis bovis TaxID=2654633 RepID=A0A8S1EC45_9PELO|nr:unnamed protein product [Caenorhabditis bovis]